MDTLIHIIIALECARTSPGPLSASSLFLVVMRYYPRWELIRARLAPVQELQ